MTGRKRRLATRIVPLPPRARGLGDLCALLSVGFVLLPTFACRREEPQTEGEKRGAETTAATVSEATTRATPSDARVNRDEIDRLRSLPYLGWAEEEAGPGSGVTVHDRTRSWPGYNLYVNRNAAQAVLIDAAGRVINTWQSAQRTAMVWSHVELYSDGDLLVVGMKEAPNQTRWRPNPGKHMLRLTWGGEVVLKRYVPVHHDVELLSDGRILCLLQMFRDLPEYRSDARVIDASVGILSDEFEIIEEVSLYDLFMGHPEMLVMQQIGMHDVGRPMAVDLFHPNSVEWLKPDPALAGTHELYTGNKVLVCVRQQDTVIILDWDTLAPVWAWGQGELASPHCATLLSNGHILVFDNGLGRDYSRVVEVNPRTNKIVWQYVKPNRREFYTRYRGANQRLPNGNTLITNSDSGEVFEVTRTGDVVWKFLNPLVNDENRRATIVRMERLDTAYVDAIISRQRN